jgi:hypothetical protein
MHPEQWSPALRQTIVDFLSAIVNDEEIQSWEQHPNRRGTMKELAEWFVDDFTFTGDATGSLGVYVVDHNEIAQLTAFTRVVEQVGERIGWDAPDAQWLQQAEWHQLQALARQALITINANDLRFIATPEHS